MFLGIGINKWEDEFERRFFSKLPIKNGLCNSFEWESFERFVVKQRNLRLSKIYFYAPLFISDQIDMKLEDLEFRMNKYRLNKEFKKSDAIRKYLVNHSYKIRNNKLK